MLEIRNITKEYRTGDLVQEALDGVSLALRRNEFVAVLGPSGSGKTTLLNIIGGLDRYNKGEMIIDGVPTSRYSDRDWDTYRNHTIGFVFQSYNLIPHQSLVSNVEMALTLTGVRREERRRRALEALDKVGLKEQAHKKPAQLSGGQMQRVAIARALVNNPAILLADEPTGALDSDTGEQVMKLLKEVAKDRLVVMVTHNPDLAKRYATRIVHLKDGRITDDSNPYEPGKEEAQPAPGRGRKKKPSMSPLTALFLSVSNLLSKKARTILVAFAASIGITGIALILSISNGANEYIHRIERDSLSEYPIEITSSSYSMASAMQSFMKLARSEAETAEGEDGVREQQMLGGVFSGMGVNDLASLKRWLDSGLSGIEDCTRAVEYRYGLSLQVFLPEKGGYRLVNPDQTISAIGFSASQTMSSWMSTYGMNDAFQPLPANPEMYESDYSLRAGRWPRLDTECVLVLTGSGGVPDILLYTMGLKDAAARDEMIAGVVNSTGADTSLTASAVFDPEEFIGISFRAVPASAYYRYDADLGVWVDISGDSAAMKPVLDAAEEIRIVGVVQSDSGRSLGVLNPGICYPAALMERMIRESAASGLVRAQMADPETDVLTGQPFGRADTSVLSTMMSSVSIHPERIPDAVTFDVDRIGELETDETRLTYRRTVKILRELMRTGKSPTLSGMLDSLWPLLSDLIHIDGDRIGEVIEFNIDEAHLQQALSARSAAAQATVEGNLLKFGYVDTAKPMAVTIYPKGFAAKEDVIDLLDAYNAAVTEAEHPEKVIRYTDYVGSLMSSVTIIIDVISYILVAFVAVSLVVSSIMIGIITYISVLERRKEIGILRALGASRRNITQVFNAETFIIGLLAGVFGIASSLLLQIPINGVIHSLTDEPVAAALPAGSGVILVLLCVFLTYVGGAIPSGQASRQDPVAALRSE